MNQTSKTIGKLLKYAGPFRITILLSAIFAAFSAVINLKSYLCVYAEIRHASKFGAIRCLRTFLCIAQSANKKI